MTWEPASDEQLAWEKTCSDALTSDRLWGVDAYRTALFLLHRVRGDIAAVPFSVRHEGVLAQLWKAAGSVSANIGEGYGRGTRADRIRFLGYALGSIRECISWYTALRGTIPAATVDAREILIARCRALIIGLILSLRRKGGRQRDFES